MTFEKVVYFPILDNVYLPSICSAILRDGVTRCYPIRFPTVKRRQSESAFYLGTGTNGHMISVNRMFSFIPKYFLQNLKNSLVAKQTNDDGTLGRPVDSWVAFGERVTIFQQHWLCDFDL